MNRIRANLRTVLSHPWAVWTLFAIIVGVYGLLILLEASGDGFDWWSGFWIVVSPVALLIVGRHGCGGISEKPLSFLWPGYRESLRKSSFVSGVRWGVIASLFVFSECWRRLLFYWEIRQISSGSLAAVPPSILEICLRTGAGFLGGIAACLLLTCGSFVRFRGKWLGGVFAAMEIVMPALILGADATKYSYVVWAVLMPLSLIFCVYFWVHLGDRNWVTSGHREIIAERIGRPREIVVQVNSHRDGAQVRSRRRVEKMFLDRMRQANVNALGRSVWAWLYGTFGPILPYWRRIATALLIGVVVQGYTSRLWVGLASWVLGGLMAANIRPGTSSLLLPDGRRQKYNLTIVAAVFGTLLLIASWTVVTALSWILAALIPPISWGTHHWQYAGIRRETLLLSR